MQPDLATISPTARYVYAATVVRVVDGDTLHLSVDLGFGITLTDRPFRLAGCNAAEVATDAGRAARDHLTTLLPAGTQVTIRSVRTDRYDRWDAQIALVDGTGLVAELIAGQWAAPWDGRGPRPVPPWPRTVE